MKPMTMCKMEEEYRDYLLKDYPEHEVLKDKTYCFMGEIKNMSGHCIVAGVKTGRMHICFHTEDFIELTEEEL